MNFELIKTLSESEPKNMLERMLKLQEEAGELAQEVLIERKASGFKHKMPGKDGIVGECVDVILCALSIFYMAGGTTEELSNIVDKKCKKWIEQ